VKKDKQNFKEKKASGFTLIELLVSIFIFGLITVAMLSVFAGVSGASQKAKAIKQIKERMEFAMNSIAKEVRMGRVENGGANYATGGPVNYLLITRNRGGRVCYKIDSGLYTIGVADIASGNNDCSSASYNNLVDISDLGGVFFSPNSKFRSCMTNIDGSGVDCNGNSNNRRGWVEMNFEITLDNANAMATDAINVQTTVSSRDYGYEEE
jgi:prepilin-type N-terminal cleavage/methylation domain-containing protein